ncbi:MAG: transglutaminase domain-containing protein, partial [Saprospiraceae bacterium]|nr:transglutaminase domain-containing protein [Saprospiraceae bacterium]
MTRLILLLLLSIGLVEGYGQEQASFDKIDRHARQAPAELTPNLAELTAYLIEPAVGDLEKVRSIYTWITHHITYDQKAVEGEKVGRINRNIQDILNRGKAICSGYANLFREMCALADMEAVVVDGYSKGTLTSRPNLKRPDHAWNAVVIDDEWRLLDATWGASVIDRNNDFVQTYRSSYFLTPPELFVLNHLPLDPRWQLLDCPIS